MGDYMIKENQAEFDLVNITKYQKKSIIKSPGVIVILDSNNRPRVHDNIEIIIDNFRDDNKPGHNTQVCGVTRQVAPDARIISFNWFGGEKTQIIDWIIAHKEEIAVVNCSFTSPFEDLEKLENEDIIVVSSSGNTGGKTTYPASLDWVIDVGAFEEYKYDVATYSSDTEDIVALTNIYLMVDPEINKIHWFNGTSCSSPVAAGMLWLYMSRLGLKFTREQARIFMRENAVDLLTLGYDKRSGYGLLTLPEINKINIFIGSFEYKVNGVTMKMDSTPILESNRTFVPIRFIAEALGCEVTWGGDLPNGNRDEIIIKKDDNIINLFIGSLLYYVNGLYEYMDVEPFLDENDRTLVPIRFIAEALNAKVTWGGDLENGNTNEIIIEM